VRLVIRGTDAFDPRIIPIPDHLPPGELSLVRYLCDCYVSLHRSEGWGLCLSEAMANGKAVIATGYSGNMEFMTQENSFPVRYTLIPGPDDMPWAEPDEAHAVELMRARALRSDADRRVRAAGAMLAEAFGLKAVTETIRGALA